MMDAPAGEVILYQREDGAPALEVRLDDDTVWLSQQQIAELFHTSRTNIVGHIRNVYDEGELEEGATCRNFRQVRTEGSRQVTRELPFYNLDLIISVGYRVKSRVATRFRMWATERLREYLVKGFTMDDAKLKNLGGGMYWRELLERIREIRSRGLTSFAGARPRNSDIAIAKNYLDEDELGQLNRVVSAYFDAAEFRAQRREPTYMRDWIAHLDRLLVAMEAPKLAGPGNVSRDQAVAHAEREWAKYSVSDDAPTAVEAEYLARITQTQRAIERSE